MNPMHILVMLLFLGIPAIALFSFLAVTVWSDARRQEREAYYRSETVKKIAETQGAGGTAALEFLREQEKIAAQHRREGQKLGGLITGAVGLGLMIMLRSMRDQDARAAFLVGMIPLLIGVALFGYAYFLAPKE
jgi:hypothetical protein